MNPLLAFVIILSILIFIHELGHFFVAKWFGIKVEEFGFGYPPRIWGKKIGETIYSINWLPFGGFVRIFGEDYLDKTQDSKRALYNKPKYVRALVSVAGVVNNFVLGIICFSIIYSFMGIPTKTDYVFIDDISPNSPAQAANLGLGEKIISVNNKPIKKADDFINEVSQFKGKQIQLITQTKNGGIKEYELTPRINPPQGEGAIGVAISDVDLKFYPVWQMPFRGAWYGLKEAIAWGITIIEGLGQAVGSLAGGVVPQVSGPIGIYQITKTVVKQGWFLTLQFVGVLSINLAILNLLPLPALDGGRLIFVAIEAIIGKRVKPVIEQYVHMFGMVLLITLMLLVTYNDIAKQVTANSKIQDIINSIIMKIK